MIPIDKQAAIDICNFAIDFWRGQLGEGIVIAVRKKIEQLPSAQPEIIRCKECKHWLDIDDGRQKHRMCADVYGDWFCADAERRNDVSD